MRGRPTRPLALILFASTILAGCLGPGAEDTREDPAPTAAMIRVPSAEVANATHPFATFLCRDGYYSASELSMAALDRCNHRVTKPFFDRTVFDVVNQHGPANEVSIAVDPTNPLVAAGGGKDYTVSYVSDDAQCGEFTVWMGTYWTTDGGITWGNDMMPGFPGDPRESPLKGNGCNTDPVLVFDDDGTLWYSGLNYRGGREDTTTTANPNGHDVFSGSQLYFAKSTDGGASYPAINFAAFGDNDAVFNDKQWFALQPGGDHMIATWSQFMPAGNVIVYTESLDGGTTWTPERLLTPGLGIPALGQFSMPQYLPAGATADIAVIWWTGSEVVYTEGVVTPGGTDFLPVQSSFPVNSLKSGPGRDGTGPSAFRLSTYPVLAVDTSGGAHDGRRYVVWPDQAGPLDSDVQVLLRWSDDGITWSAPVAVNDDAAGDQLMPWIDVDSEGGVHVAWYDRRNDPDNRLLDVYYAYSNTGGEGFHPNVRVTETSFDGDLGHHQNGGPFIGDYIGVDATPVSAHIMWADTRHTGEAGREKGSDVYAATILRDLGARGTFDAAFTTRA